MTAAYALARLAKVVLVFLFTLNATVSTAETPVGSVVETRVLVGLETAPAPIAAMMPDGWTPIPFPKGPLTGATAMMAFLDGHVVLDTQDTPTGTRLTVALIALAKATEGKAVRMFVLRVYTDDPESNPYGNTRAAAITRERVLTARDGTRHTREVWTVMPETGGALTLTLDHMNGLPGWSTGTSKSWSAEMPETVVTQTYQQIAGLVMSQALGKPLAGDMKLDSTIAELAGVFDGTQEIVAVVEIPVYIRQVFLP